MTFSRVLWTSGLIVCLFIEVAKASDDPGILIGRAAAIYDDARGLSGDDRIRKLGEVEDLLAQIEREHPDSIHADFIARGRTIGSIDVAALRTELAQDTPTVSPAGVTATEIEDAHKRLATARGLKERLSLSKDLAELLFAYGQVERLTSLAARSDYFADLLRDARVDLNTVGAGLLAGVYVDVFIEQPLAEALTEYMPENIASSSASMIATMAEAIVSGGAVLPGYVFDQAALIVESSIALRETNSELVAQVYSGTLATVRSLVDGDLSPELALAQFDLTLRIAEDYVGNLSFPSSRDAANRMWIIAQLARLKVQEGPRVGPARAPSDLLLTRLRILEMGPQPAVSQRNTYQILADEVALAFGLRSWPGDWQDATRASALGETSARLLWIAEKRAGETDAAARPVGPDRPLPDATPRPYWQDPSLSADVFLSGESLDGFTIHPDHRVTWKGVEALAPIGSINPTDATAHVSPDGSSAIVFQTYQPSDMGWRERLSVVFADPERPAIVLQPDDVFRFGRGARWSTDGAFLASTYDFDEFESDLLIVNLVTREYYRVPSDRPAEQVSSVRLDSLGAQGDGVHQVEFGHLACPGGGADCGMAAIEDAGTSDVRFRLPEVPPASATGPAAEDAENPLTGVWSGTTTAGSRSFDYRWQIDQKGEEVTGVIELKTQTSSEWSRYRFEGRFADGVLTYGGTSWITSSNGMFCMAAGRLTLSRDGALMSLNGRWGGHPVPGGCPGSASGGVSISKLSTDAADEGTNAREEAERERAGTTSYMAPPGTLWIQVASRSDLEEARAFAREMGDEARIFRAANGWFAITAALLSEPEYAEGIAGLVAVTGWPSDSVLTRGEAFVEEIAVNAGEDRAAAFTVTSAARGTRIFTRSWRDGVPTDEAVGTAPAGETVTVFGAPDEDGNCLVSPNEGVFAKCADLAAFGAGAKANMETDARTSGSDPKYSAADIRVRSHYDLTGGDRMRDVYRSRIFAALDTAWMVEIVATLNLIKSDTPADGILAYVDDVLGKLVASREILSLGVGVPPMIGSETGELYTLWLLNAARSKYQTVSHDYDALEADGFVQLSPQKSAYHAIGLDASRVEKWVHDDGREYVFIRGEDGDIRLVFDGRNNGTYNYCKLPACHMMLDILPWVKWGATLGDPSTPEERAIRFRDSWIATNYSLEELLGFF